MKKEQELGFRVMTYLLKRSYDHFVWESNQLYRELDVGVEANWVSVFTLLEMEGALSVTELAKALGLKHPTIHALVKKIMKKGYIAEESDPEDGRRRILRLTPAGLKKKKAMEPIWGAAELVGQELLQETGIDLLAGLQQLLAAMDQKSFATRIKEKMAERQ